MYQKKEENKTSININRSFIEEFGRNVSQYIVVDDQNSICYLKQISGKLFKKKRKADFSIKPSCKNQIDELVEILPAVIDENICKPIEWGRLHIEPQQNKNFFITYLYRNRTRIEDLRSELISNFGNYKFNEREIHNFLEDDKRFKYESIIDESKGYPIVLSIKKTRFEMLSLSVFKINSFLLYLLDYIPENVPLVMNCYDYIFYLVCLADPRWKNIFLKLYDYMITNGYSFERFIISHIGATGWFRYCNENKRKLDDIPPDSLISINDESHFFYVYMSHGQKMFVSLFESNSSRPVKFENCNESSFLAR
ncbi:MAG: hypothetical protein N4A49_10245 [Marinifilaceae bacterium]|jgi:hypothetical protein|nr:hypothetical protein [Marinifilaceae bacterium]